MISTNTVRARGSSGPQRLTTLTTNKVKPKTEADVLAAATATRDALRSRVRHFETRKYNGPMLTVSNMADRVVNEKRKTLMAKHKAQHSMNADIHIESKPAEKKRRGRPKKS